MANTLSYEQRLANQLSEAKEADRKRQADPTPIEPESGGNFRQMKVAAKNSADNLKNKAKEKIEDNLKKGINDVKDYFLNAVPGYKLYEILRNLISARKDQSSPSKKLIKTFIALFSNIYFVLIILAALTVLTLIINFATQSWWDKAETIWVLGWSAIQQIVNIFLNIIKGG
jgi:hypothetical protein